MHKTIIGKLYGEISDILRSANMSNRLAIDGSEAIGSLAEDSEPTSGPKWPSGERW